jgi:TPR repeat protein
MERYIALLKELLQELTASSEVSAEALFAETLAKAKGDDAVAQRNLGVLYALGAGVDQDAAKALHWFQAAAKAGDAVAQHILGVIYEEGVGEDSDPVEAVKWYRKAAEQGHAAAQNCLGCFYDEGLGVPQD